MSDNKKWGLPIGRQGSMPANPVTEMMQMNIANKQKQDMDRESELAGLSHKEKILDTEVKINEKEKQKRGENETAKELKEERGKREETQKQLDEEKRTHEEDKLGAKISNLEERIKINAGQSSISNQLAEIRNTAKELGWVEPEGKRTLSVQLEEVKNVAKELGLAEPKSDGGVSNEVRLQLKKLDIDHELAIEQMRDDRARRDKEWELTVMRWKEDKELKQEEIQGNLAVKKEQNQLIGGITERLGRVIASATMGGGGGNGDDIAGQAGQVGAAIEAGEGEFGEVQCSNPNCGSIIPIARDAIKAICPQCQTVYPIKRIAKAVGEKVET